MLVMVDLPLAEVVVSSYQSTVMMMTEGIQDDVEQQRGSIRKVSTCETEETVTETSNTSQSGASIVSGGFSRDEKYALVGWVLFIVCAVFYTLAAFQYKSLTSIVGSLIFLLACFVFMVPLIWKEPQCPKSISDSP